MVAPERARCDSICLGADAQAELLYHLATPHYQGFSFVADTVGHDACGLRRGRGTAVNRNRHDFPIRDVVEKAANALGVKMK